jgi:hypothetical protein
MEEIKTSKRSDSLSAESQISEVRMLPMEDMKKWYEDMIEFGKEILKLNIDYGLVAGINKPALFKPGAEKIKKAFGLQVEEMDCVKEIFDVDKNYIDYTYKCIVSTRNGLRLGICDGNANSKEDKFRYIFRPSEKIPNKKDLELLKLEGKGKWKKCFNKWIWLERAENPDVLALKNSIQKIAQKRAFVGAILMATGASEFFTQDIISN